MGAVWKELLLSIFISLNPVHRTKVATIAFILKLDDVIHGNISLNDFMPGKTVKPKEPSELTQKRSQNRKVSALSRWSPIMLMLI